MSTNRFRTVHSRQIALWGLRSATYSVQRGLFPRKRRIDSDVAEFLGLSGEQSWKQALPAMEKMLDRLVQSKRPVNLSRRARSNIERFGATIGLSAVEQRLLGYACCVETERILSDFAPSVHFERVNWSIPLLAHVLELSTAEVHAALRPTAKLIRSALIEEDHCRGRHLPEISVSELARQLLLEPYDEIEILRMFRITPAGPPGLGISDYPHLEENLATILAHLGQSADKRRPGTNILLHGPPGTGKTQLTRVLAADLALPLYEIPASDQEGRAMDADKRLHCLNFADAFLAHRPALLVFDEIEDVLRGSLASRSVADAHKGWFNQMLERNHWPVIWIGNTIHHLDPAFARRFDCILEVPVPPRVQRRKIIDKTVGHLVGDEIADQLAGVETIAPAVLQRAAQVVGSLGSDADRETTETALARQLGQTLKAQGHPDPFRPGARQKSDDPFDTRFLNTPHDLGALARRLADRPVARLCLHGPPGTGKTSFGRWLSRELDLPLVSRGASDLLGPYVGQTEQQIAAAFEEAAEEEGILQLDEIDTFLASRENAHRNWEVSMVNEMLTRIEGFEGILVATTNRLGALDEASLRRFDLKLHFDWLRPGQSADLLAVYAEGLGLGPVSRATRRRALRTAGATPGDYAAVVRRHQFEPLPDAAALLDAVEAEIRLRDREGRVIGFDAA